MKKRNSSFLAANNKKISFKKKERKKQHLPPSFLLKLVKRSFLVRSWLTFFIVGILMAVVYFHIFYLQIYENKKYELSSNNNYIKIIPTPPSRGIITDRNGIGLAVNHLEYGLYILPVSARKTRADFEKLQQIIPLTEEDYNRFLDNKRNNIFRAPTLLKSNLTQEEIAKIMVNKYRLDDISIEPVYTRYYPFGTIMPHVLGYVGSINDRDLKNIKELDENEQSNYAGTSQIGKIGLEKYYEKSLLGTVGYQSVEVNSTGNIIKTIETKDPVPGDNLRLAIDLPTQIYLLKLLGEEKGSIVMTNPQTAEVLAIVSKPVYDPNLFVKGISGTDYRNLLNDHDRPLYNRATMGIYPPGSTVKPFVSFTGLESKFVTPSTTIYDPGYWILPRTQQKYRDWLRTGHGTVNMHKAIVESVDTYFYDLAYRMGINKMASYMTQFGFGQKTGIDIFEESSANYPTEEWKKARFKRDWLQGDTPPVGIGQGYFTATPIQLVHALNTLINRGKEQAPHLLLTTSKANAQHQVNLVNDVPETKRIFTDSPEYYWDTVLKGMYGVNHERTGSGWRAFNGAKYTSGGKSGTAQVFGLNGNDYQASALKKTLRDHALFIAFAPFENPQASVSVVVENGGGGGKVAGPIARAALDYYILHRLPRLDPSLTCKQIQDYAIEDLQELGYTIDNYDNVIDLQQLSIPGTTCQTNQNYTNEPSSLTLQNFNGTIPQDK
ncbi:penicillin-binding protein 2 [Psittacicella hinzii]|uniref:Peptidoglycan D,D-transpeptidase MrdA n=1 Tax=Psittacicella hinzii TaxID=2028575 RepID=A0A3A1YP63_9GAMM|nr:penicillin-binding protein 2 [Psittacicella hinzii]RIY39028.1 penicillin-binding protein 2 [Psittacicella hinzii]